jgi:hypothetical protein
MGYTLEEREKKERLLHNCILIAVAVLCVMAWFFISTHFAWAEIDGADIGSSGDSSIDSYRFGTSSLAKIKSITASICDVIATIFQAVGVLMAVYGVGQMVLSFKNEDADSKSKASLLLVCSLALISIPTIIKALDLIGKITG